MTKAVAVIIKNKEGKILLMQRGINARSQQGKWENCGGVQEPGETAEETLQREVKEELGMTLENTLLLHVTRSNDTKIDWEVTLFEAICTKTPSIMEPKKCSGLLWASKEELKTIDLCSYTKEDFEKLGYLK
jgi:8-oxo-dGTP diphosphatase